MVPKWQKLQIQDLLNEVYQKGVIFKMTLFSPIDLDKIMPKIQNNENKLKLKIVPSHLSVKICNLEMGNFLEKFIIFESFG